MARLSANVPIVESDGSATAYFLRVWGAQGSGTVTSIDASGGTTGLTFSGGPVNGSGVLTLGGVLGIGSGGTGATTEATARAALLPSYASNAGKFLAVNSGATDVEWVTIGGGGGGTVTSVSGTGTVNGITLTGTVTTTGSLTLGGTLSGVDLATQTTGTLGLGRGGTGQTSAPAALDAVAGLTSTAFGRSALTWADSAAGRTALGVTSTGNDTTYVFRANNLSDLANAGTARTNLGATTVGGAVFTAVDTAAARAAIGAGTVTSITAGTGLTGGTITGSGTVALANTAVSAGSYGSAGQVATFTVDAQGRLTAAGNTAIVVPGYTRAQLGAASGADGDPRYLNDGDASGWFIWRAGDYAARATADTLGGIFIAGSVATTSGAWVRDWDWINGHPEWFGAEPGNGSFDCLPALEACVGLCPRTLLRLEDYWISDTWVINTDWREVIGCGFVSYGQFEGTRILLADGSKKLVQIGPSSDPGGNPQTNYLKQVRFSRVSLVRAATIVPNATVDNNPAAMWMQYTYQCLVEWVAAWESAIGFRLYGNVASKLDDCWYFRSAAATTTVNDVALGFLCIGDPPIFTGGNASLYFNRCKANMAMPTTPTISAGFRVSGSIADLFFVQPETTGFTHSIWLSGNGSGGALGSNINVHCVAGIFDQPVNTCCRVQDINPGGCVEFTDCYGGLPGTAFAAAYVSGGGGVVKFNGGQFSCTSGTANTIGLYVQDQSGFVANGVTIINSPRPVFMERADDFRLAMEVNNPTVSVAGASGAIVLDSCDVGYVAPIMKGAGTPFNAGVWLDSTGNSRIEINCTGINPAYVSSGSNNKLVNNSVQITATGTFNTNCLASGVMA